MQYSAKNNFDQAKYERPPAGMPEAFLEVKLALLEPLQFLLPLLEQILTNCAEP